MEEIVAFLKRELDYQLEKKSSVLHGEAHRKVQTAVNTRNTLAHSYLLEYRMCMALSGATPHEAAQEMKTVRKLYQDLTARLDALRYQKAQERGWDLNDLEN